MARPLSELLAKRVPYDLSRSTLSSDEKSWLGQQILSKSIKPTAFANEHHLKVDTIRKWARQVKHNLLPHSKRGKPGILDEQAEQQLIEQLRQSRADQQTTSQSQFIELVSQKAVDTKVRRGQAPLVPDLSKRTLLNIRHRLHASVVGGQRKTRARVEAERDPRNAYSEALLLNAFQKGVSPHLILNQDSTQYIIAYNNEGKTMLVYVKDAHDTTPITTEVAGGSELSFAIKSHVLVSAAGGVGPMVLMFADETMSEDAILVKEVAGVTHSAADPTAIGYIVFMKTRCASKAFFRW